MDDATEPCQSPEEMDDATATALVVACAEFSLPAREKELFAMAKKLGTAAKRCKIANKKLEDATARLSEADEAGRLDAVLGLRAAATALGDAAAILERACDRFTRVVAAVGAVRPGAEEEAARPSAAVNLFKADEAGRHDAVLDLRAAATALGNAAANLARACDDFAQLVAAIGAVRAGTEEEAARPKGCCARIKAWWRDWRRGTSGGVVDPEAAAPLLARDLSAPLWHKGATVAHLPAAAAGQGNDLSYCSAMQATALLGALTVLPYMGGSGGILKDKVDGYCRWIGITFAWLWSILGVGVPCLVVRSPSLHLVARLLSRVGMLAVTLLVIFYCQWSLALDWTTGIWWLVGITIAAHVGLLGWAWYTGDL